MKLRILLLLIFLLLITITIFGYKQSFSTNKKYFANLEQDNQSFSPSNEPQIYRQVPKKTIQDIKVVGFAAYWDEENTLKSLTNFAQNLNSFSPILYKIGKDGSLQRLDVRRRKDFLEIARKNNLPIYPQIGDDFDFNRVKLLLYDSDIQEKFIQSLVDEAKAEGFDGWDIDIESLRANDTDAFAGFIEKTSFALHKNNLKITVVVFAKLGNDENDSAITQDYRRLGTVADEIRIMMFGYSYEETNPGGQAPEKWLREVLKYTTQKIPIDKIIVDFSTHGYDWGNEMVKSLTFPEIEKIINDNLAEVTYDNEALSAVARYEKNNQNHQIWFENAQSIFDKIQIATSEFGVYQFGIWRLGAEDPEIWERLRKIDSLE